MVEAAGLPERGECNEQNGGGGGRSPCRPGERSEQKMVEAAGIEPNSDDNLNRLMVHGFGGYRI